jgi:hypothetical protein
MPRINSRAIFKPFRKPSPWAADYPELRSMVHLGHAAAAKPSRIFPHSAALDQEHYEPTRQQAGTLAGGSPALLRRL